MASGRSIQTIRRRQLTPSTGSEARIATGDGAIALTVVYVDASALVKLVKSEAESAQLAAELSQGAQLVSSELLAVEVVCAARRAGAETVSAAQRLLDGCQLLGYTPQIGALARTTPFDPALRALDAIHLATALDVREQIDALLAYDRGLIAAARNEGLSVISPGAFGGSR